MDKKKKGPIYSANDKRAYYMGYGMGLAGHSITEDRVQDIVVRQGTESMKTSMISGICDAGVHIKRKKRK